MPRITAIESMPASAAYVIGALDAAGFEAWAVGGWVRDTLLGKTSHDIDITTNARWEQTKRVLEEAGCEVCETGTAFGTVTVICEGESMEVTTYRVEGSYADHRHPSEVRFVSDVQEDLARRDFTINAMAWNPARGLLDPFGGLRDLERGCVRAVGDPWRRFDEDALRMLRTARFSACLGFAVEQQTQRALAERVTGLRDVASARMGRELDALVRAGKAGTALLEQPDVMCAAIPELAAARDFDQRSVYHVYDVYEHIAHVCNAVQAFTAGCAMPELQWAALLHDVAKPATYSEDVDGHGHFFDHPRQGALMADAIMRRIAVSSEVREATCALIRLHDERMPATEQAVRHMLKELSDSCKGREVSLGFALFNLRRADAVAKCPSAASWAHEVDRYSALLRAEAARGPVFEVGHLAVGGADVMRACGLRPGPAVGLRLDVLLSVVMAGEVPNEREALLAWLVGHT